MFAPVLTTQIQLEYAWRELMGPWSFGRHSVWMMLIVHDRPLPQLTEMTETEDPPEAELLEGFGEFPGGLDSRGAPGTRVAFLRSRPGKGVITDTDRAWATALYAAACRASVACEVMHLATRAQSHRSPPMSSGSGRPALEMSMNDDGGMPLPLDEVDDLIDSWEIDPGVETLGPATALLATMTVGYPGRLDVLQVIAATRPCGGIDAALATLDQAVDISARGGGGRARHADRLPDRGQKSQRRGRATARTTSAAAVPASRPRPSRGSPTPSRKPAVCSEAMRWFTIGLRDLDPQQHLPAYEEEYALIGRSRARGKRARPAARTTTTCWRAGPWTHVERGGPTTGTEAPTNLRRWKVKAPPDERSTRYLASCTRWW